MAPAALQPLLSNFKQRIDSVLLHGDRLYIGYANGSLQVHSVTYDGEEHDETAAQDFPSPPKNKHLVTKTNLSRKTIDQIGYHPQSNALVVLSDSQITLYDLPNLTKPIPLPQARNAQSFAISLEDGLVVVGCRKKILVYSYDAKTKTALGLGQAKELALPHTPRLILLSPSTDPAERFAHLCISPTDSLILKISDKKPFLSVSEPTMSPAMSMAKDEPVAAAAGMMSGIGGYMGLGNKSKAIAGAVVGNEVLVSRDVAGVLYAPDGSVSRSSGLEWPAPPDELAFHRSQIISLLPAPPNSVPTLNLHLAPTLTPLQTLTIPSAASTPHTLRCLGVSGSSALPVVVSVPTEKAALVAEGSCIWVVALQDVEKQLDGLVMLGRFEDALGLVASESAAVSEQAARLAQLKALQSLSLFATAQFQSAIDAFLTLNIAPGKVIALFPANTVSGKIHVPKARWTELFGAPFGALLYPGYGDEVPEEGGDEKKGLIKNVVGLIGGHTPIAKKGSIETLRAAREGSEVEGADVTVVPAGKTVEENETPRAALEALIHFLSDRRQKLSGAIGLLTEPLPTIPRSGVVYPDPLKIPSVPMTDLSAEQLFVTAQVVYTALLKVYLLVRPVLVGSLCRIENWCEVEEVEELLKAREKYGDLIDLYQGKKMHKKALALLQELAKQEDDRLDKYPPTVRYLQKLGPDYLDLIFESSRWIFAEDWKMALQIFTADEPEVEALPRDRVAAFLASTHPAACIGYLEHIINTLSDASPDFHDQLAEMYLKDVKGKGNSRDQDARQAAYETFLTFLKKSDAYRADRLLGKLSDDQHEARAILLGRLGNHEGALQIYVYKMENYAAAEEYCAHVFQTDPDPLGVFLLLLRIYLRPKSSSSPILLEPALALIAKHGIRLDALPVLDLIPPLVTMAQVQSFFIKTLRDGHRRRNEARVVKDILKARKEQVERALMGLQKNRVKITDSRICPQCHKRLGQSVIAVHAPHGEVTHYQCKDAFSAKLARTLN